MTRRPRPVPPKAVDKRSLCSYETLMRPTTRLTPLLINLMPCKYDAPSWLPFICEITRHASDYA